MLKKAAEHMVAIQRGETISPISGLPHYAHANAFASAVMQEFEKTIWSGRWWDPEAQE